MGAPGSLGLQRWHWEPQARIPWERYHPWVLQPSCSQRGPQNQQPGAPLGSILETEPLSLPLSVSLSGTRSCVSTGSPCFVCTVTLAKCCSKSERTAEAWPGVVRRPRQRELERRNYSPGVGKKLANSKPGTTVCMDLCCPSLPGPLSPSLLRILQDRCPGY